MSVYVVQLGPEQAQSAAQAAMASATAVLQQKRVEVLIPPQAATWLQVCNPETPGQPIPA